VVAVDAVVYYELTGPVKVTYSGILGSLVGITEVLKLRKSPRKKIESSRFMSATKDLPFSQRLES